MGLEGYLLGGLLVLPPPDGWFVPFLVGQPPFPFDFVTIKNTSFQIMFLFIFFLSLFMQQKYRRQ